MVRRMPPGRIQISLESFPYYLCKITKELLLSTAQLHLLRRKKAASMLTNIPWLSKFLLLSGPQGSQIYQERLAMALAKKFDATLLICDDPLPQVDHSPSAALHGIADDHTVRVCDSIFQLLDIVFEELERGPVVVFLSDMFVKDIETCFAKDNILSSRTKKVLLGVIPDGVLVIGSQVNILEDGKEEEKTKQPSSKLFLNKIDIRMPLPDNEAQRVTWKRKLDQDAEILRARRNNAMIRSTLARSGWSCEDDLKNFQIKDRKLTDEFVSQMVGYAILNHLLQSPDDAQDDVESINVLSIKSIKHGFRLLEDINRADKMISSLSCLKDVTLLTENDYEKKLLADVIPSDELGVSFEDVGALDNVKDALRESVMLPLKRPELFSQGQLMKPYRGILLFGPPGTGKTMLAKAVATEAGANFINVSVSSITSKWYGEAEKYARAVFTLASKIAPAVVFIDEVDSVLSCRGCLGESEASRRLKNEFMVNWDGLRTKDKERVLVLAATNRPFDLDEAVIRRFPRRLMVGLPDSSNRHKILRVILSKEELAPDVDLVAVASMSDGYSGSDLRHLCVIAAHCRIREILEEEKNSAVSDGRPGGAHIRPLKMDDFKYAHEQVGASSSSQSANISQLLDWNNQYGEGHVSRKKQVLTYFL